MAKAIGVVIVFLLIGMMFGTLEGAQRDRDRRARVAYALSQVGPAREAIVEFHGRERRWPTYTELGKPEWTPYPDGGGYRLQADGSVRITFTVLPELKGRSIYMRPVVGQDGSITWACSSDPEFPQNFLPATCRR